jgi:hypothetical protein
MFQKTIKMNKYRLYKGAWICIDEGLEQQLTLIECKSLLNQGGLMVRNIYNFDVKRETSFWFCIKDNFEGLEGLSTSTRRDIRKSLKHYDVLRISGDTLLKIGYPIYVSAQQSYKIKSDVISYDDFVCMVNSYIKENDKEFWGVKLKESGEFVALAINTIKESCCEYNTLKCKYEALKDGTQPYYGLIYEMNRYYLEERKLSYVNDGARTITNHSNIQNFLEQKFKFRKAYCDIRIVYKWYLGIVVKILYPFRHFISNLKIKAVLNMEAMQRGEI